MGTKCEDEDGSLIWFEVTHKLKTINVTWKSLGGKNMLLLKRKVNFFYE